ncbi:hypothetical protein VTG60DRAFT_6091 [Thermothelomyces hinnuleus]
MDDGSYDNTAETTHAQLPPAFILAPLNSAARKAVDHERNGHLRFKINDTIGIWVNFADQRHTWTLGKGDTDIYLPDTRSSSGKGSPHISPVHASFQLVEETGAVLLFDSSDNRTVEPLPHATSYTVPFRPNARSVLVAPGINPRIAFGKDHWYQFEIQWHSEGLYSLPKGEPYQMGPRNSRTKKYVWGGEVGAGSYGTVSWVLDATNGKIIAVKKFHKLSGKNLEFATREIANLLSINRNDSIKHEHILEILDYSGGGKNDNWGEIFMPLMGGNLKTLVENVPDAYALSNDVLRQMLLALECIASHRIIHRDVKPENILWEYDATNTNNYRFCLGDFGLSNDPDLARTAAGTEPFMAPEVFNRKRQTTKVDIWSLFATIVWTRTPQFRQLCAQMGAPDLHKWLVDFSKTEPYANIRRMASIDPNKRPSATEQLAILDGQHNDVANTATYRSPSGDELGDDFNARFSSALRLPEHNPDLLTYGSGSSGAVTSPELPYYEPYASRVYETYWEAQAGPSRQYMPPSPDPAGEPRGHGAYVMPYEDPYGPAVRQGSGSGTAVPDNFTAVAETDEESARREPRRRRHH